MPVWAILFVIGVVLNCAAVWGAPSPWYARIGWLLYAIAAIIWLVAPESVSLHSSRLTL